MSEVCIDKVEKKSIFGSLVKRYRRWRLTGKLVEKEDLIVCILEDHVFIRIYRRLFGVDRWQRYVSKSFGKIEDIRFKFEELGGTVHEAIHCACCGAVYLEL